MGYYALGLMVTSVFVGMVAFYSMKMIFRIPLILNLPGSILIWMAFFLFTGWVTHDMFAGHVGYPEPPVIDLHVPLTALAIAAMWYAGIIMVLTSWRRGNIPTSHGCQAESCAWDGSRDGSVAVGQCNTCKNVR